MLLNEFIVKLEKPRLQFRRIDDTFIGEKDFLNHPIARKKKSHKNEIESLMRSSFVRITSLRVEFAV